MKIVDSSVKWSGAGGTGVMDDCGWVGRGNLVLKSLFMKIVNSNVFWGDGKGVRGGLKRES